MLSGLRRSSGASGALAFHRQRGGKEATVSRHAARCSASTSRCPRPVWFDVRKAAAGSHDGAFECVLAVPAKRKQHTKLVCIQSVYQREEGRHIGESSRTMTRGVAERKTLEMYNILCQKFWNAFLGRFLRTKIPRLLTKNSG